MAATCDREVILIQEKNDCRLVRRGRHDVWYSPRSGRNFLVPTRIKSRQTANEGLKQAGLPKQF